MMEILTLWFAAPGDEKSNGYRKHDICDLCWQNDRNEHFCEHFSTTESIALNKVSLESMHQHRQSPMMILT
jgi:hypothetical protein